MSNKGSESYVGLSIFSQNELAHIYYIRKQYEQCFKNSISDMSILDMLFNCGKIRTKQILEDMTSYEISKINSKLK